MTLQTTLTDDERSAALLQALGFDKLSPGQRELALGIANRYNLDPMLKHLVMIDGRPYITRDGLLHVAHQSGQFDGIEATEPELRDGFWRSTATVYRKDMSRPFKYSGRYPERGQNARYGPEMATKVAEVMCLRRAFDVAAPTVEERWEDDGASDVDVPAQPTSLAERIAARAEAVASAQDDEEPTQAASPGSDDTSHGAAVITGKPVVVDGEVVEVIPTEVDPDDMDDEPEYDAVPVGVPGQFDGVPVVEVEPDVEVVRRVTHPDGSEVFVATADQRAAREASDGPTLEEFAGLMEDVDKAVVKRIAKELYPDAAKFADLTPAQLQTIVDRVVLETTAAPDTNDSDPAPKAVPQCGMESPYGTGLTCTQDKGHPATVPHRAGLRETW